MCAAVGTSVVRLEPFLQALFVEAVSARGLHLPGEAVQVLQADAALRGAAIP